MRISKRRKRKREKKKDAKRDQAHQKAHQANRESIEGREAPLGVMREMTQKKKFMGVLRRHPTREARTSEVDERRNQKE